MTTTPEQIPTPLTDAAINELVGTKYVKYVRADFARTLERELLASQAREARLREALEIVLPFAAVETYRGPASEKWVLAMDLAVAALSSGKEGGGR